jgi:hypothetical protein
MNNRYDRDPYDDRERDERSWLEGERPRGQSYRDRDYREPGYRDYDDRNQRGPGEPRRDMSRERVWTRDTESGNPYGYWRDRQLGGRFNEGDESHDSWRSGGPRRFEHDTQWRANQINRSRENYRNWYPAGLPSQYGKGPKGYVRSDARIREDVCDRLTDDDEVDASDISVTVREAEVTLEGSVSDRHIKHRAEEIAEAVSGVRDVTNRLRPRKGVFQELGDKIKGEDDAEHRGHRGDGPRGVKEPSSQRGLGGTAR